MKNEEKYLSELAVVLKALANPVRLRIIRYLLQNKACTNADLVSFISKAQATISQHVKVLVKANLVTSHMQGTCSIYTINIASCHNAFIRIQSYAIGIKLSHEVLFAPNHVDKIANPQHYIIHSVLLHD